MNNQSQLKLISVKCPDCGASLSIEEGRKQAFCTYCGAKVLIQNDNEHIYRTIDEAEIAKQEKERELALKEKEIRLREIEAKNEQNKRSVKIVFIVLGAFLLFYIFLFIFIRSMT